MKILIIGCGKMGEALVRGWLESDAHPADNIDASSLDVVEPTESRREYLDKTYGITSYATPPALTGYDYVLLAVKPQVMPTVGQEVKPLLAQVPDAEQPILISIAAGLPVSAIEEMFDPKNGVIRVMPNTPLSVGAGASALCSSSNTDPNRLREVTDLFGDLGVAFVVDESLIDVVGVLSGSGPAYIAWVIQTMADVAASMGLDRDIAVKLSIQTALGTSLLCEQPGATPESVREAVCSPGGTTLAALGAMKEKGFTEVFEAGMEAALARSKELSGCTSS